MTRSLRVRKTIISFLLVAGLALFVYAQGWAHGVLLALSTLMCVCSAVIFFAHCRPAIRVGAVVLFHLMLLYMLFFSYAC